MPRGWVYQNMKSVALQDQWFIDASRSNTVVKPSQVEELGNRSINSLERLSPYTAMARIAMPNYLKAFLTTARNQGHVVRMLSPHTRTIVDIALDVCPVGNKSASRRC